jgi:nitrate reductase beta subunit
MLNVNEAIQKIKSIGASNVRIVPMAGQPINSGDHQIEIKSGANWEPIVSGVKKKMAEDIVNQAINKVILG